MKKRIMPSAVVAVLAIMGASIAFAAESPGSIDKSQLDALVGQPVDISPWAYAWRADVAVQQKPEAYFIPRRLERIDKVYRTAFYQMPPNELKSLYYNMPDLITPLLPKPKGELLAGLLWATRLADYRVELCWPADAKNIPAPENVEVRVYPTAFGWFGWCKDEILGKPKISADGRTWTYNHHCTKEIPVVVGQQPGERFVATHRCGSGTEMVAVFCEQGKTPSGDKASVPTIRVISPTVGPWKRMDIEIEWGFQAGTEKTDFDGRLETDLSILGPVAPLADDKGTKPTGAHAWQSRAKGEARRGIILPLVYVPGDRPSLDTAEVASCLVRDSSSMPYNPSSPPTLDSHVTVWTRSGGFTFRPIDLEKNGPILISEHGVFINKAGSGKPARQFAAELAAKNLKSVRQMVREHREAASWNEVMQGVRLWRCPPGTPVPPFPSVPDPVVQVQVPDPRWTAAWRTTSQQLKGKHMWGGIAVEVGQVAHEMDLMGLHEEADKVYQYFLKGPGAKSDGDYTDGKGAFEYAAAMRHDMGYSHDGTHASTGRMLFAMADRYFLTGDKQWFQRHRARMQAAADWIIRQRTSYMKHVPNRQDLLVAGMMPPQMSGDYALPSCDWRWYYPLDVLDLQGLQRFADAVAELDAKAGRKYHDEAAAFRKDLRRVADRQAILSPVRLGRDGQYHSYIPFAAYTRGAMLALESGSLNRPQGDTIVAGLLLAAPFAVLDANDARMVGTLDVMEELGTSPSVVRALEETRKKKGFSTDDAWFWNFYAGFPKPAYNANMYLLQDDVPNFLRFWMNSYAALVGSNGKMWELNRLHPGDYDECTAFDHGTAGWFLEQFRNLLMMEDGQSLWIARATPRAWLEQGKKITVKNAPTYFGPLAYEIVSDVDHGKITATIEIPSRDPPQSVLVRLRHPKTSPIKSVTVDGKAWSDFDAAKEVVRLHDVHGSVRVEALYWHSRADSKH
jgi:hypothetical protein